MSKENISKPKITNAQNQKAQNIKIKNVGIVLRPKTKEAKKYFLKVKNILNNYGINVYLDSDSAKYINLKGEDFSFICENSDIIISIGGDGTLISATRRSFLYQKPILGINIGHLGFLTTISKDDIEDFLPHLVECNFKIEDRVSFVATVLRDDKRINISNVINDIVLCHHHIGDMIEVQTSIDGNIFNSYFGDGVIVSTPTGSTAYNMSAGGPIVYPRSSIFTITPICPHSFTQRSLVLPVDFNLDLQIKGNKNAFIIIDGQKKSIFEKGDILQVRASKMHIRLIRKIDTDYFKALRQKFNWGSYSD